MVALDRTRFRWLHLSAFLLMMANSPDISVVRIDSPLDFACHIFASGDRTLRSIKRSYEARTLLYF
jgi:hypothetical protein